MPEAPLEETLRRIIREELEPVWKRFDGVDEKLAWVEEQFEWIVQRLEAVDQRFDSVDQQFADLKKMLEGLIDEKFPPIDRQPRSGGPPSPLAQAAKGGS